jgi:hypothetical protein
MEEQMTVKDLKHRSLSFRRWGKEGEVPKKSRFAAALVFHSGVKTIF